MDATRAYYEKNANQWTNEKVNSFHHEKQFRLLVSLLKRNACVLDIGCSWGIHIPLFLGIGRALTYQGIDTSAAFLRIAKSRFPQMPFSRKDISKKSALGKKKYDAFWAAAVLMHLSAKKLSKALEVIGRHARPNALLYVTLPTERPNAPSNSDRREFSILTPHEQRLLFTSRGWKIEHSGVIDGTSKKKIWRWYLVRLP